MLPISCAFLFVLVTGSIIPQEWEVEKIPLSSFALMPLQADVALIVFTLSAVPPAGHLAMLQNAWSALQPGGWLCIRDHGLYDMVQLRIQPEQWVSGNMYKRGDGTLASFFTVEVSGQGSCMGDLWWPPLYLVVIHAVMH